MGKQMRGQGDRHQDLDGIDMPVTLPTNRMGRPHKYPSGMTPTLRTLLDGSSRPSSFDRNAD